MTTTHDHDTRPAREGVLSVEWQNQTFFPVEVTQSAGNSGKSHPDHLCHTGLVCGRDDAFADGPLSLIIHALQQGSALLSFRGGSGEDWITSYPIDCQTKDRQNQNQENN